MQLKEYHKILVKLIVLMVISERYMIMNYQECGITQFNLFFICDNILFFN